MNFNNIKMANFFFLLYNDYANIKSYATFVYSNNIIIIMFAINLRFMNITSIKKYKNDFITIIMLKKFIIFAELYYDIILY